MMVIDNKYELGQIVYLKTDVEQFQRIVTMIKACADGGLYYQLSFGKECSDHYEVEITDEKNVEIKVM
jgi:hypothetical protein